MAEKIEARIHVGKDADHDMVLNAVLAGIEIGRKAEQSKYWGPDSHLVDGTLTVTMRPRQNG